MKIRPAGPRDFGLNGYVLAQAPNPPIIIAVLGSILSRFLNQDQALYYVARALFFMGLTVWSWLEVTAGVNLFRRSLGVAGLAWALYLLQDDLSSG
ncbi:MAG: hypothetical protein M3Y23_00510 [Actinomycetota bacterium]|nr:hypothetical protein [Actinomycetota bacterium]